MGTRGKMVPGLSVCRHTGNFNLAYGISHCGNIGGRSHNIGEHAISIMSIKSEMLETQISI